MEEQPPSPLRFMDILLPQADFILSTSAGYIWAWVAVLTAAVGLWRIRAVGSSSVASSPTVRPPEPPLAPTAQPPEVAGARKERVTVVYSSEPSERGGVEDGGGECEEIQEGEDEAAPVCQDADAAFVAPMYSSKWRRRGDLGWYRHQDRTVIDGSVVRLWSAGGLRRRMM